MGQQAGTVVAKGASTWVCGPVAGTGLVHRRPWAPYLALQNKYTKIHSLDFPSS